MPREAGPEIVKAMRLVIAKATPYDAAKRCHVALSTMYRSRLYKLHQAGKTAELRAELKRLDELHATKDAGKL